MDKKNGEQSYVLVAIVVMVVCAVVAVMVATRLDAVLSIMNSAFDLGDSSYVRKKVLIDAGHGGVDGGATAGKIVEKDINLSFSLKLADLLNVLGYDVTLVRDGDFSIHDEDAKTIREKKRSDLNNRLKLYNESDYIISIHQNTFRTAKTSGVRLFYNPDNEDAETLANNIRQSIITFLQPNNKSEMFKAKSNIFLLFNAEKPAVLIECGFMTNPSDLELIQQDDFQRKMVFSITYGLIKSVI